MRREHRPSWLIVVCPAVLVAILTFGYFRPTRDLIRLQQTVDDFSDSEGLDAQLQSIRTNADVSRRQVVEQEKRRNELLDRWTNLRDRMAQSPDRSQVLDAITKALLQNQLFLTEKGVTTDEMSDIDDPVHGLEQRLQQPIDVTFPEIRSLTAAVEDERHELPRPEISHDDKRRAWVISCVGTYANVQQVLKDITEIDDAVTPIRIEMEPAKLDSNLRRWKLFLLF